MDVHWEASPRRSSTPASPWPRTSIAGWAAGAAFKAGLMVCEATLWVGSAVQVIEELRKPGWIVQGSQPTIVSNPVAFHNSGISRRGPRPALLRPRRTKSSS